MHKHLKAVVLPLCADYVNKNYWFVSKKKIKSLGIKQEENQSVSRALN
jgi:hypothetical protein